jgi:hypothetical protein
MRLLAVHCTSCCFRAGRVCCGMPWLLASLHVGMLIPLTYAASVAFILLVVTTHLSHSAGCYNTLVTTLLVTV